MADTSQLVTIKGLNKVWKDGVIPLYEKLDKRLDRIGSVYKFKAVLPNWDTDFLDIDSAEIGDVYIINTGFPSWSKDPENFPEYNDNPDSDNYYTIPRMVICSDAITDSTWTSNWENYWECVNLNLTKASTDNYGLIKLRDPSNDPSTDRSLLLNGEGRAHVEIPIGTRGTYSTDTSTFTPGTLGLVSVGEGLVVDDNGKISLKINDNASSPYEGNGLKINPSTGLLSNFGVRSIRNSEGTKSLYNNNIYVKSTEAGKINFADGNSGTPKNFDVSIYGWSDKQEVSTAVKHSGTVGTGNPKVGNTSKPIYVSSNGEADVITSIDLGDISTAVDKVAHFKTSSTAGTDSYKTVYIQGYGTTNNNDPGNNTQSTANVALQVNGASRFVGALSATKVYHAVWNDISDAIEVQDNLDVIPGYCYYYDGTEYHRTTKYCQKGIIGIHSDTAGSILGRKGKHKELDISVGGFVLAYVDKYYEPGTPLTSAPDGKLTKMSLWSRIFHLERLVATYWKPEMEAEWGDDTHTVEVNGRHWVKVR